MLYHVIFDPHPQFGASYDYRWCYCQSTRDGMDAYPISVDTGVVGFDPVPTFFTHGSYALFHIAGVTRC